MGRLRSHSKSKVHRVLREPVTFASYTRYRYELLETPVNDVPALDAILVKAEYDHTITIKDYQKLIELAAWKGWHNNYKPEML